MIRGPIERSTAIILGIVSLLVLLGAYTWVSHRQHQKNPDDTTMPTWSQLGKGVAQLFEVNKRSGERWIVVCACRWVRMVIRESKSATRVSTGRAEL